MECDIWKKIYNHNSNALSPNFAVSRQFGNWRACRERLKCSNASPKKISKHFSIIKFIYGECVDQPIRRIVSSEDNSPQTEIWVVQRYRLAEQRSHPENLRKKEQLDQECRFYINEH
ncbi:hypothetical protein AVEN_261585-1 [Araneus ventricosus]|uniref:Uncharacterized protein n=1 Tax=Araneus ventricosus TaxID=182803 RepID=A0A4Y2EC97_ARAVE|nr:hypothetical protein AVEN_261585-1 [Araneus ventricosus]